MIYVLLAAALVAVYTWLLVRIADDDAMTGPLLPEVAPEPPDDAPTGTGSMPVAELRPCDHVSRITITPTNAGRVLERLRIEAIREMHGLDLNAPMIQPRDKQ